MKVTIQQRSVYHKYAEVQVEVPDNIQAQMILMFQATDKIKNQEDCSNFMKFVKTQLINLKI